ncbi:hypothetical protein QBZ16_004777 [Prototheca wickerhamii]|uniref:Acyl-coenzyme A oxidase n=1 Tax=Prototheca wickerhamii TaxID=3111 RepID=A0AAD9IGD1_PROWI|nr:hypothetical protein QBZ16_004777 [Prototheca wickerhamii]
MAPSRTVDERTKALVAPVSAAVQSACADPKQDAANERSQASFNPEELAVLMQGGQSKADLNKRAVELLQELPFGDKTRRYMLTRPEEYVGGLEAGVAIWNMRNAGKISHGEAMAMRRQLNWPGGLELHLGMFIPSILAHGTDEQQAYWMPKCERLEVIGTYAQTELGHGTFLRGLETVAVFDPDTDEFVVHSPTLTATKWWPGGLGKTATHVILMARLVSRGRDYGVHSFVMQIRDLPTHRPLPGVTVGDIGPKLGYQGVDNGYLSFDHVRIPRSALLSRWSKLDAAGNYTPPPPANAKASYATMVFVRADIVKNAGDFLSRAVTIATRYAAVRRQTAPAAGARELQVLDYDNVSQTLLPLVARAYALSFMGRELFGMYSRYVRDRERGVFGDLPELHALSSGLKAACTEQTANGIETCRRTCGGHGYSQLSGLPNLFAYYVQNVTWEGENSVMYLQAARFLIKAALAVRGGKLPEELAPSARFLGARGDAVSGVRGARGWADPAAQVEGLAHVARHLTLQALRVLLAANGGQPAFEGAAWNGSSVDLIRAARAFCMLELHRTFVAAVEECAAQGLSAATADALRALEANGDLLESGFITQEQAAALRDAKRQLVREVRPDAVAYTDGFGYDDYLLNSALGRKDGDVYRALLDMAQASPLNDSEEGPAWDAVLKAQLGSTKAKL